MECENPEWLFWRWTNSLGRTHLVSRSFVCLELNICAHEENGCVCLPDSQFSGEMSLRVQVYCIVRRRTAHAIKLKCSCAVASCRMLQVPNYDRVYVSSELSLVRDCLHTTTGFGRLSRHAGGIVNRFFKLTPRVILRSLRISRTFISYLPTTYPIQCIPE